MFKRLSISLLVMGLAAFGLGAAAFAWFSDSETGEVSIQAGSVNIAITANQDCDGDLDGTIDGTPFPLEWHGIVPGDTTSDCFFVQNTGDGDLDVFVKHSTFTGSADLLNAIRFTYDTDGDSTNGVLCVAGNKTANDHEFTAANGGRGCDLGDVASGNTLAFQVRVEFVDSGNQNTMQGDPLGFDAIVTGYTG